MLALVERRLFMNLFPPPDQLGMTLVEIVVSIAILGIALTLGLPSFKTWIENGRIRSTADSIFNGLQLARAEAIRNNNTACFVSLTDADGNDTVGASWCVRRGAGVCGDANELTRRESPYLTAVTVALDTSVTGVLPICFNGTGGRSRGSLQTNLRIRLNTTNNTATADHRTLEIRVTPMGGMQYCDPGVTITDPRRCV